MTEKEPQVVHVPTVIVDVRDNQPEKDAAEEKAELNKYAKEGWGSRFNFQLSYGLKMEEEDMKEGNEILKSFMKGDEEDRQAEKAKKSS